MVVVSGRAAGQVIDVDTPRFLIGRDVSCHLRPNSRNISRHHATIEQRGGRVFIRDQGTTNGTYFNERLIQGEEVEARHGDRLQVGPLLFTLVINGRPVGSYDATAEHHTSAAKPAESARPILEDGVDALAEETLLVPSAHLDIDAVPGLEAGLAVPTDLLLDSDDETPAVPAAEDVEPEPEPDPIPPPAPVAVAASDSALPLRAPGPSPSASGLPPIPSASDITPTPALSASTLSRQLRWEVQGDVLVVTVLARELADETVVAPLRAALATLADQPLPHKVVVNLERVRSLSHRAVIMFLAHSKRLGRAKGGLRLCVGTCPCESMSQPMPVRAFATVQEAIDEPWG
jgi:predicted component of type VI protein secretion system